MTYDACSKVCRAYDTDALRGPVRGSGEVYLPAGLTFLPSQSTVPVVIDRDHAKQVGEVFDLCTWEWTDQRWIITRARIDRPPAWLRYGTRASISTRRLRTYEINDWTVISRALVDEVTIVGPGFRPVEPCAEVVLYRQAKERKPQPTAQPAGRVVYTPPGGVLRRPSGRVLGVR